MNAIISLCHFCELHGPSVVFCTQAFRDLPDFESLGNMEAVELLESTSIDTDKEQIKVEETRLWKYGLIPEDDHTSVKNASASDTCVACRSFSHNKPGFISNDDGARVSYISSQFPQQSELYNLVRQACIRSLSCEVCPGKEGPIYFGDEARGHVLSHTFFLRDVHARGFQRWYSILVLMKDKMLLLNSWPFLVNNLRQTIDRLQQNASKIYEKEESKVSHRAIRSAASMMSDNFRKQRVAGQPRSLPEMVGEVGMWQYLHVSFTWLLKAAGLRLQERLVEGPSTNIFVADASSEGNELSIRQLFSMLGGTTFHRVLHHLLIGHQVIIRGSSEGVVSSVVSSLKPLIPKYCCNAVSISPLYIDARTCNILGLQSATKIPQAVLDNGSICLLDVTLKEESSQACGVHSTTKALESSSGLGYNARHFEETESRTIGVERKGKPNDKDISENVKLCNFKILRESSLPVRPPQVLSRIESAVSNVTLTQSTLMVYLSTVIYEWTNKVKVWIHVQNLKKTTKCQPEKTVASVSHQHPIFRSPSIPILRSPTHHSLSRVQLMPTLRTSPSGGLSGSPPEVPPQDEHHQLLAALGSTEWDVPLLEFWAKQYSQHQE